MRRDLGAATALGRPSVPAWTSTDDEARSLEVGDGGSAIGVIAGVVRNFALGDPLRRAGFGYELRMALRRFGAPHVQSVPACRIRGIEGVRVEGPVEPHDPLLIAALAMLLECESIFVFGATLIPACRVLARNLPDAVIVRLERAQPQRLGAPHAVEPLPPGITRLVGSAASYDLTRYSGKSDLVIIDGAPATDLRAETDAAFGLLSELGTIVWDGYPDSADAYAYLNALAPTCDRPLFHIAGTRLALYSRWDIVRPEA